MTPDKPEKIRSDAPEQTVAEPPEDREILQLALQAGQILLENGAEISRVEETVYRICRHYGLHSASVFVLSNGIFLTSGDEEEPEFAKVLFIPVNRANLSRVAEVNQLSRQIEADSFTLSEARQELERIQSMPELPYRFQVLASGISAACFCHMFKGTWSDCACSFFIGILLYLYILYVGPHFSKIVRNILGSAWIMLLSIFFYKMNLGAHLESMMIGGIIIMVPGVAFTNGIRDMADEDYISGSVRMMDAILVFFCIAIGAGFTLAVYQQITGGILLW